MSTSPIIKLQKGTVVKIWHTNKKNSIRRGLDYVCVGCDTEKKEFLLLKANSFNVNGKLHKSVKKVSKRLPYAALGSVNSVMGVSYATKKPRDISGYTGLSNIMKGTQRVLTSEDNFTCSPKGH